MSTVQTPTRAGAATRLMADRIARLTTDQVIASLEEVERQHDAIADKASTDAMALRTVRAAFFDDLERRYPQVVPALDAWADIHLEDTRTYAQVIIDEVRKARP